MPRRHGPIDAEMTGYREYDGGPRELRVDLVDRGRAATVASMSQDEALWLVGRILDAAVRCRRDQAPDEDLT